MVLLWNECHVCCYIIVDYGNLFHLLPTLSPQNIIFEGLEVIKVVVAEAEWEKPEGDNDLSEGEDEPMDMSPWAGSDREYSYEEVGGCDQNVMGQSTCSRKYK